MLPTIPPPPPTVNESQINGGTSSVENLSKLLASTKSLSFALSKPNNAVEGMILEDINKDLKRKHHNGCSNASCSTNSDVLVIARKSAMLYFRFNTSYKKVHKICSGCNEEAETFLKVC
jgi:glyceraldehyde-3-phosphate dehydrogenase/erythrose-4-phosphate dehydrogenase